MTQALPFGIEQITLLPLGAEYAADAARLHILGQPGAFLTSLGAEVLTVLYRTLPQAQTGFGFAVIDPAQPQRLLGFVSATTGVGALFVELGARRLPAFLPPLLRRFVRHPGLALRAVQTLAYPFLHPAAGESADETGGDAIAAPAELLSIMVEPALRSLGIGALLVAALQAECRRRGIVLLDVTVDAANAGAQRFYLRHGFTYTHTFTLYGRPMQLYQARLRGGA